MTSLDNHYAPPVFFGTSSEDAADFLVYVERFTTYKQMSDIDKLQFIGILLRGAAGDFYDSLDLSIDSQLGEPRTSWEEFKEAFLARFGRLAATAWKDVQELFATPQKTNESALDFIGRMTRIAKRVEDFDERMLQQAIFAGLRPELRTHVLQANTTTLEGLIQAARIADAAVTSSQPVLSQVLDEIRTSNAQHAQNNAVVQQLSTRLDKLQMSSINVNDDRTPRRRVRFNTSPRRSSSTSPRRFPTYQERQPSATRQRQHYNNRCSRCGMQHRFGECPAVHAACFCCGRLGHFKAVCRSGPRQH